MRFSKVLAAAALCVLLAGCRRAPLPAPAADRGLGASAAQGERPLAKSKKQAHAAEAAEALRQKEFSRNNWLAEQVEDVHCVQRMLVLDDTAVQDDLELTEQQRAAFAELASESRGFLMKNMARIKADMYRDKAERDRLRPVARAWDERLRKILSDKQFERVDQLALRAQGGAAILLHPDVAARLQLSEEQVRGIEEIVAEAQRQMESAGVWQRMTKGAEVAKAARRKAIALLRIEQRQAWNGLLGAEKPE